MLGDIISWISPLPNGKLLKFHRHYFNPLDLHSLETLRSRRVYLLYICEPNSTGYVFHHT